MFLLIRKTYYAGGFNGGKSEVFMKWSQIADNVLIDQEKGVTALRHDESYESLFD